MKEIRLITMLLTALIVASCSEKKKTTDIIVTQTEAPKPQGPISMQEYTQTKDVQWLNKKYQVIVSRTADEGLPMVKDETGQEFVDNQISVRVIRSDGSVFFDKSFTKAAFNNYLNDDYSQTGILEGLVFDKVDGNQLVFAASVCHPQTDEYIPLILTVSNFGDVAIRPDTELDTSGNVSADEDEI